MTKGFLMVFITLLELISAGANNGCSKLDACRCEYQDGNGIDLSQIQTKSDRYMTTTDPKTQDRYYFHPCWNIKYIDTSNETDCAKGNGYTLCRFYNESQSYQRLGSVESSTFSTQEDGGKYLVYKSESRITTIQLLCLKFDNSYIYVDQEHITKEENQTKLLLFSPYACITTIEEINHSSVGQVLLIMFFTGTFTYFLIASIVRFMYFGARGIEVIPNLDFWKDLPGLVRDGVNFLRDGCRVERSPDPDSYDAI
ncbi:uncharacterized protein LOC131428370 [Malaya genurostris]|uniref:uncharacterized protein LOC131428370 n=1 Tax=Malaya genurostris TaxID=325434 RepID=UPI0026F3AEBC|nr:uncharacterized protein LOC131428370 [Malaya genurostris]